MKYSRWAPPALKGGEEEDKKAVCGDHLWLIFEVEVSRQIMGWLRAFDGEEGQQRRVFHLEGDRHGVAIFRLGCGHGIVLVVGEGPQILARDDT
jgi:hypothetical protein